MLCIVLNRVIAIQVWARGIAKKDMPLFTPKRHSPVACKTRHPPVFSKEFIRRRSFTLRHQLAEG
jgi:hypothetical protein